MRDAFVAAIQPIIQARERSLPHFERKFYHFVMGMLCFSLYAFVLSRFEALILLSFIGGGLILGDFFRLRSPAVNHLALRIFGRVMRREELKSFSGNSFFVMGLFVITLLFPKPIVLMSALFLAIGDPIAAMVGSCFGKHKLVGKKSLEGALANWFATGLASFLLAGLYFGLTWPATLFLAIIGGTVSMSVELLPVPIDDNFTIPVFSAVILSLIHSATPLF
jgi:dolichol kinase